MLALAEAEASICECGLPHDIADADPDFHLVDRVCPVCSATEQHIRKRDHDEREREKDYDTDRKRAADGRTTSLQLGPAPQ